jgi:hypothetical protein
MAVQVTPLGRTGSRAVKLLMIAVTVVAFFARAGVAQQVNGREYDIKAGFLYNFARLVDWPDDAFKNETDDLRLVVIGHDCFDGALDRLVAGKTVGSHRIVIAYVSTVKSGPPAQMAFVSASEEKQLPVILSALKASSTLTVSDISRFANRGGIIGLTMEGGSVHFVVNRATANQARLRVSSRILSLATVVLQTSPEESERARQ